MRKLDDDSPTDAATVMPEPADPREVQTLYVGTPVRDAAVDPQPEDFLAPVGAGTANPHGPAVVAPGIHALETKPVLPGDVTDPARQEARESELAARVLVADEPVPDVVEEMAEGAYDYKVDAADPTAAERTAGQAEALAAAPIGDVPKPKGNASQDAWVAYAVAQGADPAEAEEMSRDELRERYS